MKITKKKVMAVIGVSLLIAVGVGVCQAISKALWDVDDDDLDLDYLDDEDFDDLMNDTSFEDYYSDCAEEELESEEESQE